MRHPVRLTDLADRDGAFGGMVRRFETSLLAGCLLRFHRIGGRDRTISLAGQAFTAIIPLVIVVSALSASDNAAAQQLARHFHLGASATQVMSVLFSRPPGSTGAITVSGVIILLYSVLSFTRALQRTWEVAWDLPKIGFRGTMHATAGFVLLVIQIALLSVLGNAVSRLPAAPEVSFTVRLVLATVLWLQLQYLLLSRRVSRRRLLPGAAMAGLGELVVGVYSLLWMPRLINSNAEQYGVIGVTFALLTWFILLSGAVVATAVVSAEVGTRRANR